MNKEINNFYLEQRPRLEDIKPAFDTHAVHEIEKAAPMSAYKTTASQGLVVNENATKSTA